MGSIAVDTVSSPKTEVFYWVTIMFSQTLGTALGDWVAGTQGLGYLASALIFSCILCAIAFAYFKTKISRVYLFWMAFIFTRPLGAVVGDFLDKPMSEGGLGLDRYMATATLILLVLFFIFTFKQKASKKVH